MTIKEIANLAGVSISTVSKIVNQKDTSISPQTRERVLRIVKEYHYSPYASTLQLNQAKSFLIGVLTSSSLSAASILDGLLEETQSNGYSILLFCSYANHETELKSITSICKNHVDAVIWEPINEKSLDYEMHFKAAGIPTVMIGSMKDICLQIDYAALAYESARHLLDRKHTKIAFLEKIESFESAQMIEGYKKCLFDHQISFQETMICDLQCKNLYERIRTHEITGIICSHFEIAGKLYEKLKELNYQIPYELSIISFHSGTDSNHLYSPISYIEIPFHDFGKFIGTQAMHRCELEAIPDAVFSTNTKLKHRKSLAKPYSCLYPKILVTGSINIDTYLNVDKLPEFGKTVTTTRYSVFSGGKGTNQAIGAAKLGHNVSIIGVVGNDMDADTIYSSLHDNKIGTAGIRRHSEANTGHAYIYVQKDGDSMISILSGANDCLLPKDILDNEQFFEDAGYLLIQTEIPLNSVITACKLAKKHGVKSILKPSALHKIDDELLTLVEIMVPNEAELNELSPEFTTLEAKASSLIKRGLKTLIVTLGARGCFFMDADHQQYFSAPQFSPVDNTGASDAFICALASYLQYGYSLSNAIRIAIYAAGFSITRQGVIPALIDKNTLEAGINRMDPALLRSEIK